MSLFKHPLKDRDMGWLITEAAVLRAVNRDPSTAPDHERENAQKIKEIEAEQHRRYKEAS